MTEESQSEIFAWKIEILGNLPGKHKKLGSLPGKN